MCGIAGLFSSVVELPKQNFVLKSLNERGPDGRDFYVDKNIWLYHSRLAINDLTAAGKQPIVSPKTGNVLVLNGEIYNFRKIIQKYTLKPVLKSDCDTEVLFRLIELIGLEEALSECEGMFALAFWDAVNSELSLSRDRFGQKPLFKMQTEESLVFGSTASCIEEILNKKSKISQQFFMEYLLYGFPLSSETLSQDVEPIDAGTISKYKVERNNNVSLVSKVNIKSVIGSERQVKNHKTLSKDLIEAIEEATYCDHSPAIFLSGGVDSNLLLSICNKYFPERISSAITLGFENTSDEAHALQNVTKTKIEHVKIKVTDEQYIDHLRKLHNIVREPIGDVAFAATSILSKEAKKYTSVVLSGDGADEIFYGYNRHILLQNIKFVKLFSKLVNNKIGHIFINKLWNDGSNKLKLINNISKKSNLQYLDFFAVNNPNFKSFEIENSTVPNLESLTSLDTKFYLKNNILRKTDRATMANSVECRLPFLFEKVTTGIATQGLISGVKGKVPLRKLLSEYGSSTSFIKRGLTPNVSRLLDNHLEEEYLRGFEKVQDLLNLGRSELESVLEDNINIRWRVATFGL